MDILTLKITNEEFRLAEALELTETLGRQGGLSEKEVLRLRLLTEELVGMLRGISGDVTAEYRIGQTGKSYTLRLSSDVTLDRRMREQLIAASTSGTNEAARGFMGSIREMIEIALLPTGSGPSLLSRMSMGLMSMSGSTGPAAHQASAGAFQWSMKQYKSAILAQEGEDNPAWDELEKSIVASIADEVRVLVDGSYVEIAIDKNFG